MASSCTVYQRIALIITFTLIFFSITTSEVDGAADPLDGRSMEISTIPTYLGLIIRSNNTITNMISSSSSSSSTCDMAYGFMPCSTTAVGSSLLMIAYGFVMHFGASCLSGGTESMHEMVGPEGVTAGAFLTALSSFPNAALVLASGLGGTTETADSQVLVGIGLMTGSTVLLLTAVWGSCVVLGKCDLEGSTSIDGTDTKGYSLTGSGVSCEMFTTHSSKIMSASVAPFIMAQLPQLVSSLSSLTIFISFLTSVSLFPSYCIFQIFQPWIHHRRVEYVQHKHYNINYNNYSKDDDQLEEPLNKNTNVDEEQNQLERGNNTNNPPRPSSSSSRIAASGGTGLFTRVTGLKLLLGTAAPAAISSPLVNVASSFSTATGIPSFFVSFVLLPFATSLTHIVSSYAISKRKNRKSISLTLETIYGTVTMNNVVSLSTFLGVVYFRNLTWDFSAELLAVVVVGAVMGGFCSFRTKFPLWSFILAFSLYPISLVLVYVLQYVVDWS